MFYVLSILQYCLTHSQECLGLIHGLFKLAEIHPWVVPTGLGCWCTWMFCDAWKNTAKKRTKEPDHEEI